MSDITVNGRFFTRAPTGVDRYAAELLRAWLPGVAGTHSVRALMPGKSAIAVFLGDNLELIFPSEGGEHRFPGFDPTPAALGNCRGSGGYTR